MAASQQMAPARAASAPANNSQLLVQLQQHRQQQQPQPQFNNRHPPNMVGVPQTMQSVVPQQVVMQGNTNPAGDANGEQKLTPQEELSKFVESL